MLDKEQLSQFLSGIEAFSEVSPDTLEKLVSAFHERPCHPGEVVVCQGARGAELCIVVEGELSVTITDPGEPVGSGAVPTVREVAILKAGDIFGEIGVVSGTVASATVSAMMAGCRILTLGERELHDQVLRNSPSLAVGLLRSMKRYL